MSASRLRWCVLLLVGLAAAGDPSAPTRCIAVIGASVSDGFGVRLRAAQTRPDGARPVTGVNMAALLRAAAKDPAATRVVSLSTSNFFAMPEKAARDSVEQALAARPSMILAVDWLFWSSYGSRRAEGGPIRGCDDRLERLERALKTLQPLVDTGVPIVLGDLPDMHCAVDGGMLTESMVPDAECLTRLNARIGAWCAERRNVAMLDLRDLVRRTLERQPIRACNRDWCEADLGPLMQRDRLHPTLHGTLTVVAAALQAADAKTAGACSSAFELDPRKVRERLSGEAQPAPTAPAAAPPPQPAAGDSASTSGP